MYQLSVEFKNRKHSAYYANLQTIEAAALEFCSDPTAEKITVYKEERVVLFSGKPDDFRKNGLGR